MTLTLKYFIHQVFILYLWEVIFVFFAIFGLGKVLWFCLTKVSGKNQRYTNLYWFCKNLQIGTKCGEKTKLARYPRDQKFQEITKYFRIEKFQFHVSKGIVTSVAFESKDDPTQMTKIVIYNYILYYIQKAIHFKLICTNVHS